MFFARCVCLSSGGAILKPRVLHLLDSFRQGGSESQALKLASAMDLAGRFEIQIACLDRSGPLLDLLPAQSRSGIPEFKLNTFYDPTMVRRTIEFSRLLKRLHIQIIHTHDFYTNIFGMIGAAVAATPIRIASRREASKRTPIKRFAERQAYRLSSAVIANCEQVRSELIKEGVHPTKVVTVHNGVQIPDAFGSGSARAPATSRPHPVVCIVANLRPVKDHAMFLRAAKRILERCPKARFVVAGEGQLMSSLQSYAVDLGIGAAVDFLGRCDNVPELLSRSNVCVLSSQSEGFPNVVLEYMAAGKPVVSTCVGGVGEAITDNLNGFLVEPGDDAKMADRIVALLCNPDLALRMGQKNRAIAERFSAETQRSRVEALYMRLLDGLPAAVEFPGAPPLNA
jgi:L-malate glycosyltransferase